MTSIDIVYKTMQTIKEMLKDRNINIENIENFELNEIKTLFKIDESSSKLNATAMIAILDVNENFRIIFCLSKFKFTDIKKYLIEEKINHVLVITKDKLTNTNYKSFEQEEYNNIEYEYFIFNELMFNISKHVLVPKHEIIIDNQEVIDIMTEYKIKNKAQFPLISKDDPMSRYLNAKSGNLIRITRNSPTSGMYIVYRYCV
jgi:DNA-directed RNA polymerase I, II, and III subunit RPABC1